MNLVAPLLATLPWTLPPFIGIWRARNSKSLDDFAVDVESGAPFVSVIIPARNERRNIERCVRSVLTAKYPSFEVIVVDDHSTDGTGDIARAIASDDSRVRVIGAPDLPTGWFGKQWACASGAREARGTLLLFTDADTRHADDLLPRTVNALRERTADLVTVGGHQEMHSFWERVIQPMIFGMFPLRYGGTEDVSNAKRPENVIANGQYILVRRDTYDAMGGHELVRDRVAEDLSMAQEWVRAGRRLVLLLALRQMSTHMYASLSEVIGGWRKNLYAGGRTSALGGRVGLALYPVVLIAMPLLSLVPVATVILAGFGLVSGALLVWSAVIVGLGLIFWGTIYRFMGESPAYALLYPVGLLLLLYIVTGSVARGAKVEWKDRSYLSR